ncbi:hypothetical protein H8356DRAFT_1434240 [Neocallimastix lanati (nom. inval.)]|nr:hypothetical protein H8356DRAFT_1434240 [Neocallimastix sp. JGI-2020a]
MKIRNYSFQLEWLGVGGMTVSPDFQVVERRRQNDKACKDLFLKCTQTEDFCLPHIGAGNYNPLRQGLRNGILKVLEI